MLTTPGIPFEDIIGYLGDSDLISLYIAGNQEIRGEILRASELRIKQHPEFPKLVSLESLHEKIVSHVAAREPNIILEELTPLDVIAIDMVKSGQTFSLAYLISNYFNKNPNYVVSRECFKLTQLQQDHILGTLFKIALANDHAFTCVELFMYMDVMGTDHVFLERYFAQITRKGWITAVKWMLCTFYATDPIRIIPDEIIDWAIEWDLDLLNWLYDSGFFQNRPNTALFLILDETKLHRDVRAGDLQLLKWFVQKIGGEKEFAKIPQLRNSIIEYFLPDAERYHRESAVKYLKTLIEN